jgi:hypothetical protein
VKVQAVDKLSATHYAATRYHHYISGAPDRTSAAEEGLLAAFSTPGTTGHRSDGASGCTRVLISDSGIDRIRGRWDVVWKGFDTISLASNATDG